MRTMVMIKLLVCKLLAFLLTLSSERIGLSSAIQLCQYGVDTTHRINLNMDSSEISGSRGMCSCRIQLVHDARLSMFPDVIVPGCSTSVSLSHSLFEFPCSNGKIEFPTSYIREQTTGDVLWLFVTSTDVSNDMSGQLQIKTTPSSSEFKLECFDENTNTSATTPIPTTTTTSTTTYTTTTKLTFKPQVSSTSTKPDGEGSSTMSSQANPSSTDNSDGSTVPAVSTTTNSSPTDDTLKGDNNKKFPGSGFKLECFDSNTNTSATTPVPTTTTTTRHTTSTTTLSLVVSSAITIKATSTTSTTFRTTTTKVLTVSVVLCKAVSTLSSQNTSAAVAGGIGGCVTLLIIIVIVSVIFHRRYRCVRRTRNDQIPESRDHPTYSDLTNREHTEYEHIDHNNATTRVYQNVSLDIRE